MTPQAFDLIALARSAGSSVPLFALQAAAALGLLASTLLLSQQRSLSVERRGLHVGFGLGLASFIIAWFVSEHMKGPVKLNLSIDLVLLAGLIGGWRGGLVCLGLSQLARLIFSGTGYFLASSVDQGVVVLAGWWAHAHFHAAMRERFSLRSVAAVWGARVVATYVGLALAQAIIHAPAELVWQWASLRALVLPLSLAVLIVAALLMRLDAQIDQQRLREHELTHKDQLTGLPNRKSLSEFVEAFWRADARREGCLAVIELANLRDFLLRYGPEYGGLLWAQMGDVERAHSILRPNTGCMRFSTATSRWPSSWRARAWSAWSRPAKWSASCGTFRPSWRRSGRALRRCSAARWSIGATAPTAAAAACLTATSRWR